MFVFERNDKSIASENYRTLRTNIQYLPIDKNLKTILVTSSEPREGKTTVAGNLALSLAKDEKKVILVDCDLRKPKIDKYLSIENSLGLSEIITENTPIENVIQKVKGLDVITSGKISTKPSEILDSKSMEGLIKELKESYDYIILDSTSILEVTDSQILAAKVDGTILVVKVGKTKKDSVINAKNLLDKVGANIIGTVLNGVERKSNKHYYKETKDISKKSKEYKD